MNSSAHLCTLNEAGDALDATTACQTAGGGFGDALDVVTKDLAVALGAALAETLTATAHVFVEVDKLVLENLC